MATKSLYYAAGAWRGETGPVRDGLVEAMDDRGWEVSSENFDSEEAYLRSEIVPHADGTCWLYLNRCENPQESLLRALAAERDEPLTVFEVVIDDTAGEGDRGRATSATAFQITPEGDRRESDGLFDIEKLVSEPVSDHYYKPHLAVKAAVREVAGEEDGRAWRGGFRRDNTYSERLLDLISDVSRAEAYSLEEMHGQRMVRCELPDGSKRMSAVNDEELEALTREVGEPAE